MLQLLEILQRWKDNSKKGRYLSPEVWSKKAMKEFYEQLGLGTD
jgi:hypothetical protein